MKDLQIAGKKVPVALLALMLIITGAGAAAGVTFDGNVQGDAISKVDQAILVDSVSENGSTANNALGKVSDDGTEFRFAANVNQGDLYMVDLNLRNEATQDLNGVLTLKVPDPLEVEVDTPDGNISIARTSMSTWNFNIVGGADTGTVKITIAIPDDAQPGFYTIEGDVRPSQA